MKPVKRVVSVMLLGALLCIGLVQNACATIEGQQNGLCATAQFKNNLDCGGYWSGCPGQCILYSYYPSSTTCKVCICSGYRTDYCTDPGNGMVLLTVATEFCATWVFSCYCDASTYTAGFPTWNLCGGASGNNC